MATIYQHIISHYTKNPSQLVSRHGDVSYKEKPANAYSTRKTLEVYLEFDFSSFFFLQTRLLPTLHKILTLARMMFKM